VSDVLVSENKRLPSLHGRTDICLAPG